MAKRQPRNSGRKTQGLRLTLSEVQMLLYRIRQAHSLLTAPTPVFEYFIGLLLTSPSAETKPRSLSADQKAAHQVYARMSGDKLINLQHALRCLDIRNADVRRLVLTQLSESQLLILRLYPGASQGGGALTATELSALVQALTLAVLIQSFHQVDLVIQLEVSTLTITYHPSEKIRVLAAAGELVAKLDDLERAAATLEPLQERIHAAITPA